MNYSLRSNKIDPKMLYPKESYYSEEYLNSHYDLYLTTNYVKDKWGKDHKYYQLHASQPHTLDTALGYEIQCPHCHNCTLRQVGRPLSMYDLGLFVCPDCDSKE